MLVHAVENNMLFTLFQSGEIHKLVIAIDIGTFASGFALQSRDVYEKNPLKIEVNDTWKFENLRTHKTMTALLLNVGTSLVNIKIPVTTLYSLLVN